VVKLYHYERREWFAPVATGTLHVGKLAELVVTHATDLFPGFFPIVPPRPFPSFTGDDVLADLVLVDHIYRSLYLLKVAVSNLSLTEDVYPSMMALKEAYLEPGSCAAEFCRLQPGLNEAGLKHLIYDHSPKLALIVNEVPEDWVQSLREINVKVGILELFRANNGDAEILRINGEQPDSPPVQTSKCHSGTPPNMLIIEQPSILGAKRDRVAALFNKQMTIWVRSDSSTSVRLHPHEGGFPLPPSKDGYEILRHANGDLEIKLLTSQKVERK
jgi:hypothetical protein